MCSELLGHVQAVRSTKNLTKEQIIEAIENGNVLRKEFIANPGEGIWCHQFSVEILYTGVTYNARFLQHGSDSGPGFVITREQMLGFVNRHF